MTRREWIALAGLAALPGCGDPVVVRSFPPSNEDLVNPERGFYVQRAAESLGNLTDLRENGISLVLLTLDLKHYRNRPLDDARLSVLDESMHRIRDAGVKVIFRAAYGFTDADYRVDPSDLNRIRGHIAAMSKVLASHAPWVFAVQAGMLGPWGEWHGSNHGDPPSLESRAAVVKAWTEALPAKIYLQIRRPMFLRDIKPDLQRCGWHNDALLANPDDMGTYAEPGWDRKRELEWCYQSLKKVPFGGETVPDSEATPPSQVLAELLQLHTTYLNSGYHGGTLEKWKQSPTESGSLLDVVKRRLGYRLTALRTQIVGESGQLILRNDGFASPLTPRRVSFSWYDVNARKALGSESSETLKLHHLLPGESNHVLTFKLPPAAKGLVPALRLADDSDELENDGRHAIRIAGLRFDDACGWNLLE